jgi:polyphosphate kinase 2 (PPK2 family)
VREREHWHSYMDAYQELIRHTATPQAPWYVVPADHKWFTHIAVSSAIIQTLEELHLAFPKVSRDRRKELETARKALGKSRH